jgi:hypothetical protein
VLRILQDVRRRQRGAQRAAHPRDTLTLGEGTALARAGYILEGRALDYVARSENPDLMSDAEVRRFLRTVQQRPEVAAALRQLLEGAPR